MEFDHTVLSDEEMLQVVDQWEADGLLEPSWLQTQTPELSSAFSSLSTTPSDSSHRTSYPFPTAVTDSSNRLFFSSPPLAPPTTLEDESTDDTPATDKPRSSRDPAKRKQQNRNAQRAHRDRQKKLIRDLWTEVHALRAQNKQLLAAKTESRELQVANGRLRREIEALERIWVEAVTHGDVGS